MSASVSCESDEIRVDPTVPYSVANRVCISLSRESVLVPEYPKSDQYRELFGNDNKCGYERGHNVLFCFGRREVRSTFGEKYGFLKARH